MRVNMTNLDLLKNNDQSNATSNLSDDNFMVGVILAGKSIAQVVFNLFIGEIKIKISVLTRKFLRCHDGQIRLPEANVFWFYHDYCVDHFICFCGYANFDVNFAFVARCWYEFQVSDPC